MTLSGALHHHINCHFFHFSPVIKVGKAYDAIFLNFSPVIKVGKAYDVMANRERVSSDSDDDLGSDAVIS